MFAAVPITGVTMLFTLSQARTKLAKFVGSGSCDSDTIDARINEAVARLADSITAERMRRLMRATVTGGIVPLPANVETVLWANTDTVPAKIFGRPYEFLSSGLGDLDYRDSSTGYKDLADRGDGWPTMYDVPEDDDGLYLHLYSDSATDVGPPAETALITYTDTDSRTQQVDFDMETWPVSGNPSTSGTVTELIDESPSGITAVSVERVVKPTTAGYVYLVAVDHETGEYTLLARYNPTDTIPQFRRYELTNVSDSTTETCVLLLVRLRVLDLLNDDDVVPLDSMQALKLMMMAIRDENAGRLDTAGAYEGKAIDLMDNRTEANTTAGSPPTIINVDHRMSLGRTHNTGMIL